MLRQFEVLEKKRIKNIERDKKWEHTLEKRGDNCKKNKKENSGGEWRGTTKKETQKKRSNYCIAEKHHRWYSPDNSFDVSCLQSSEVDRFSLSLPLYSQMNLQHILAGVHTVCVWGFFYYIT